MSEIKPCPHCGGKAELYVREYTDLEANYGDARVDCVSEKCFIGGWHKPNNAIKAWNARPIEDDLAASRDRASDACATVQRERDALRDAMQEICCQSNEDWAEARADPNATLNRIHEIAVDAFYGKSE